MYAFRRVSIHCFALCLFGIQRVVIRERIRGAAGRGGQESEGGGGERESFEGGE